MDLQKVREALEIGLNAVIMAGQTRYQKDEADEIREAIAELDKPADVDTIRLGESRAIREIKKICASIVPLCDNDFDEGYSKAIADIVRDIDAHFKKEGKQYLNCETFRCYIASSDCEGCCLRSDCFPDEEKIQQYAESYHARKLAEESAAIIAASDRLGAALDESDKGR